MHNHIATMLHASADHLTADERQMMADGELNGCLVQDGATALALVYEQTGIDKPDSYSPERWAIEQRAASLGCLFVLWEVEGQLLDGFPDMTAEQEDQP